MDGWPHEDSISGRFTGFCYCTRLVLTGSAGAASSNGAQVSSIKQCDTNEYGTACVSDHIVSNFVDTPAGNTVVVGSTGFDIEFEGTGGACSFQQNGKMNFHIVLGPRITVSGDLYRQEFRYSTTCNDTNFVVCETVMHYHQVNGVIHFQRSTAVCTDELIS